MNDIAIAFVSLVLVGFVLILIYSLLLETIKILKETVQDLTIQRDIYLSIIREANEKGVPPESLGDSKQED
jgi:hypothetical protein